MKICNIFEGTSVLDSVFLSIKWLLYILRDLQLSEGHVLSLCSWHSYAAVRQIQSDLGETEHTHKF